MCCAVPPLQVSQQELGRDLGSKEFAWDQMWQLLQRVAAQQQRSAPAPAAAAAEDATAQLDRHLREAQGVALTPPPYPGAFLILNSSSACVVWGEPCSKGGHTACVALHRLDRHPREAQGVALMPPPYPGASVMQTRMQLVLCEGSPMQRERSWCCVVSVCISVLLPWLPGAVLLPWLPDARVMHVQNTCVLWCCAVLCPVLQVRAGCCAGSSA